METSKEHRIAALEALLFIHGEPLALQKIAAVIAVPFEELPELVREFRAALETDARGLTVVADVPLEELGTGKKGATHTVQLVTKPALAPVIKEFVKREMTEDLTPASLETLSLLAYLGPLPRARLDYLRGVNSSFILRSLMMRGLVERYPDPEHASITLYRATLDLWKHLGVEDQRHLPEYEKFKALADFSEEPAAAPAPTPDAPSPEASPAAGS